MDSTKDPSIIDNNDIIFFNISEAEDSVPFYELSAFVRELIPDNVSIMDKVLRGEDIDRREIQKVMDMLIDKLVPLYNRDGSIDDPKMAHLHETIVAVGKQL